MTSTLTVLHEVDEAAAAANLETLRNDQFTQVSSPFDMDGPTSLIDPRNKACFRRKRGRLESRRRIAILHRTIYILYPSSEHCDTNISITHI
jgi:hypothetical protein